MPRYAAVDIGSNSVRLLVADAAGNMPLQTLAEDRSVTRLGESVFRQGRISEEALAFLCEQLTRMAAILQKHDVHAVRAVATAAVRDASNRAEFLERAALALGARIEVISGQEEARLIHLGVCARWPHPRERRLLLDIGGGSAEVMLSESGRLVEAFSKPLGAVRLNEVFLKSNPPTAQELHRLEQFIDEKLQPALDRIGAGPFDRMIVTSASAAAIVCAANRIPRPRREEADRLRATASQVRKLYHQLASQTLAARRKVVGIGPRRAEIIVSGAAVFNRVLDLFEQPSMYYSVAGVRDGIVADLLARGAGRELSRLSREQRQVVESMVRRYGVDLKHARHVAGLTQQIFESAVLLHRLPPAWGKVLEAAAYLCDIGHFVSDTGHHKHSAYLVDNSDLPGFTDQERRFIALLCRFHRKSLPAPRHEPYQTLDPESRKALLLLIPLLRLADALEESQEQKVTRVRLEARNGTLLAAIQHSGDADLEQWAAERLSELFRQVYGLPVSVTHWRP
jgi:exopolyphosphatase/guanosine-5'-triphosphate,3'-diphosphate pyrophosphatase